MKKLLTVCSIAGYLLLHGLPAAAAAPAAANPGHWRASPLSVATGEDGAAVRVRNLDTFPKLCVLQFQRKTAPEGDSVAPIEEQHLYLKGSRTIQFPLPASLTGVAGSQDLTANMGCVAADDNAAAPDAEACALGAPDCGQLCLASAATPDQCPNEHLLVTFKRAAIVTAVGASTVGVTVPVTNTSRAPLSCIFATALKGSSASGNVLHVTAQSEPMLLAAGQTRTVSFAFGLDELVGSDQYDASRSRVTGLCVPAAQAAVLEYSQCEAFKRSECNWVREVR